MTVKDFKVGDAVFGLLPGGAYAQVQHTMSVFDVLF